MDNFYRHLEATLDLSFVRDWARELYVERGRPSIDPVVVFKLQLVMSFEGIRSERKFIEMTSLNLTQPDPDGHRTVKHRPLLSALSSSPREL